jgi:transmembrane sensor
VTTFIVLLILQVHRIPGAEAGVTRIYSTTVQQRAVINFDDGTRVTLSPQTTLKLQHFGPTSRVVVLDSGEAYFEVAKVVGAPFVVHSGAARAQVLGTSFLVRHDVGDSHVHVSVADGKVRVTTSSRGDASITLSAGQMGDVTDSTTQVSNSDDLTPGTEWAPGRIMFRHVPAATVLKTVSLWYGYHFCYADQDFGKQNVTMIVSTRSSAEALAAIEQVFAVNLTVVGDTITLVPQSPRSGRNAPRIRTYDVWTPAREVGR